MPRIFDNIDQHLIKALQDTLKISQRADFCVGYFNLRGWRHIDTLMECWQGGEQACCRLMIGMQDKPEDDLRRIFSLRSGQGIDQSTVARLKTQIAQNFREQLLIGAPSNADHEGLRRLSAQLKAKRLVVKLFLRHKLHAKLYLLYSNHPVTPITGYLGSSNLTLAGLMQQGELNVDVVDYDACRKLEQWFNDRWEDRWCLDISQELASIIDESWAREQVVPPYHIYLKIAYHLSEEARQGLLDFRIPRDFKARLFEYQVAAVKIAARHLNKRGGVLIGDVVGLGKTLMATALARIMQDDFGTEALVICPKNLVKMWQQYLYTYGLVGKVVSVSNVTNELPGLQRFRLVVIDESHNLRNREGKRYKTIKDYIERNESKCILLTATPYNKTYLDLSAQLRLFLSDESSKDLGIRPEKLLSELGEARFISQHQCPVRSLMAFEKSEYADDWRELMRLYLVRRTRSFIQENYARSDGATGRKYLEFSDGTRSYFPTRLPRTVKFLINDEQSDDPYAQLYSENVIEAISGLTLPRYGLGNYIAAKQKTTAGEAQQLASLSRAGKRLMGFCRTNLFKRLESGGPAFIQSLERHILRNYIFLHAIENGLELPIGTQDAELLDTRSNDEDEGAVLPGTLDENDASTEGMTIVNATPVRSALYTEDDYQQRAAEVYAEYAKQFRRRFKWLRPTLFNAQLQKDLLQDARGLLQILNRCGNWEADKDAKLAALVDLLTQQHPNEKILIFTQFADTVHYLSQQLKARGIAAIEGVTGDTADPTELAWRFSPLSNDRQHEVAPEHELRVLVATDVLSEGQNLQDAAIVVNYDLPWAIIRLIQRAGRVDRIGQQSDSIYCYSFLPTEGVERLIRLRERVRRRLKENAEVVGTDEAFFEDDANDFVLFDLYNEKAGVLDGELDTEVDLASQAYQIWKNATDADPRLKHIIEKLPNVSFSTRAHEATALAPEGVLVYMRTSEGNDSLAWINRKGESVTQSQLAILRAAACDARTPAIERPEEQHELVRKGVEHIIAEELRGTGGQLGGPSGARRRTYERLKHFVEATRNTLFPPPPELYKAIDEIYRYPLQESAKDTLNRQIRSNIADEELANMVIRMRDENRLCHIQDESEPEEPRIICSLGLFRSEAQ
ncbi:MAG TPA: helicase-related protein [Ktedonobacteraceae bacterium]|nr:helicase-related protein [Ktedonobacteraceae bacterium]